MFRKSLRGGGPMPSEYYGLRSGRYQSGGERRSRCEKSQRSCRRLST